MQNAVHLYSEPMRLIPQGWVPEGWHTDEEKKLFAPVGVHYFTVQDAVEVRAIAPACFPAVESSELTLFFALARLASSNRMAVIRTCNEIAQGHIVAVGMVAFRDDLVFGRNASIDIVIGQGHHTCSSKLREALTRFLQKEIREEAYPQLHA